MRTLCTVAATVALLVGATIGVAGADEDDEEPVPTWAWYIEDECTTLSEGSKIGSARTYQLRDARNSCRTTWSDPRLSGIQTVVFNVDCYADTGCVYWGTQDVEGADGSWSGPTYTVISPERVATGFGILVGAGGYEGLVYVGGVHNAMGDIDPDEPPAYGLVYRGDPPLMPK